MRHLRLSIRAGILGASLAAGTAMAADLVAYEGKDMIRLTSQSCTNAAVLERLHPQVQPQFRQADAVLQGQRYTACWSMTPTAAYLVYEDGDEGLVPLTKLEVPVDV